MAICKYCGQEQGETRGCFVRFNGQIPFGDEFYEDEENSIVGHGPCPFCGVAKGELHHVCCEIEQCPECHEPYFSCGHELPKTPDWEC